MSNAIIGNIPHQVVVYQDMWVRIAPPNSDTEAKHVVFIGNTDATRISTLLYELWLTYNGSNLVVETWRFDAETGAPVWKYDEHNNIVVATRTVRFDEDGSETIDEFYRKVESLPKEIVQSWYAGVLSIVPQWMQ